MKKTEGWEHLIEWETALGIHDKEQLEVRVKWVNKLRAIVARRMPKSKSGVSLVSDIDLILAKLEERQEALNYIAEL